MSSISSSARSISPFSNFSSDWCTAVTISSSCKIASASRRTLVLLCFSLTTFRPSIAISLSSLARSRRNLCIRTTDSSASSCNSRSEPRAEKNDFEAVDIEEIKCTSTVSIYQESFSCSMAFVANDFRPEGVAFGSRMISECSETISNVRGFSRWKSSSP